MMSSLAFLTEVIEEMRSKYDNVEAEPNDFTYRYKLLGNYAAAIWHLENALDHLSRNVALVNKRDQDEASNG